MKKTIAIIAAIMMAAVFVSVQVKAAASPAGTWKTISDEGSDKGKEKSNLEIIDNGGVFSAKVTKLLLKPQDTKCTKCVGALKDKPVVGMFIMSGMKKTGNVDKDFGDEYAGGKIMDPDNGKYYNCKFWLKGGTLVVRGYLGPFYRTQRWYKVK